MNSRDAREMYEDLWLSLPNNTSGEEHSQEVNTALFKTAEAMHILYLKLAEEEGANFLRK